MVVRGNFSSSWAEDGANKDSSSGSSSKSNQKQQPQQTGKLEEILPPTTAKIPISFEEGLDYILSHFEEPVWPRTISIHATEGRQILVYNKEEALARYKQANLLDCRINAYPKYTEYKGINRQAPNFIFLDLDNSTFKTERALQMALEKTLKNLHNILNAQSPTVIWSGNGYHIYQPVSAFPLEQEEIFISKSSEPSKQFLQFAEMHLTDHKSDPSHHPSIKSCMIRIPGSHNFKCVQRNNNNSGITTTTTNPSTQVKIIQKWDGIRPKFNPLLYDFNIWLADKKLKEINELRRRLKQKAKRRMAYDTSSIATTGTSKPGEIRWIEILLQTPIEDYRKIAIGLILAPYLINIKKLSYGDAFSIIKEWLNKCNSVRKLDSSFNFRIKYSLDNAIKTGYLPMKLDTLRTKNKNLYDTLKITDNKKI